MSATLTLCKQLIQRQSLTPEDANCQDIIAERLETLGFNVERLNFGDVSNLWATYGSEGKLLVFAGHTDVVPTGPESQWTYPPFAAIESDGYLFGRGTADMKGSLAAMLTAIERYFNTDSSSELRNRLGFLITSDEEGIAINGTKKVIQELSRRNVFIDYCLVGEPSSSKQLGDIIKIGRRGSLSAKLTVLGKQGHVAYPQLADNPIHKIGKIIDLLVQQQWDQGNASFPPTSLQISNIHGGTGANNVIPDSVTVDFNFRYSTETNATELQHRVEALLSANAIEYNIDWHLSGEPFLTEKNTLRCATAAAIKKITTLDTEQLTTGGTSDGRFIAPTGSEVVELGPCNASIHKIDEHVKIADLDQLSLIYEQLIVELSQ